MQKSSSEFQGGEAVIVVCNNTRVILRNLAELGLQLQELASFTTTYTTWNYIFLAGISSRNNLFFCTNRRDGPEIDQFRPCHPPCQKHNMAPCGESTTHIYGCPTSYHWLLLPPFQSPMMCFSSMLTYTNWENQEIGNQQHHWSHGYEIRNPEATAESDSFMGVVKPAIKSALNHGLEEPAALKTY